MSRAVKVPSCLRVDVAVIGSGPAGAVTAALCAEAGHETLMLEEGPNLPLDACPHFSGDEILRKYRNRGLSIALGKPSISYMEGRCVGGGSEVNRGLYHRTPAYVLDQWARDYKVDALSATELAPHFEACEQRAGIADLPAAASPLSQRLGDGAAKLRWDSIEAPRLFDYAKGRKQSMTETFIPQFRDAGGRLISDTRALRIRRSTGRWHVTACQAGREIEIEARGLFVACGAVQTPALLRRSGIRRNIGDTLAFHPMLKAVALFPDAVNRPGDPDPVHQIKQFEPRFGIGCSISTPALLALALAGNAEMRGNIAHAAHRMGIYYVQNGGGRARVRCLPGVRDPLVLVRHEQDSLDNLYVGLRHLVEALFAAGAEAVQPCIAGLPLLRSQRDIDRLPLEQPRRSTSLSSVHVFASCPMGEDRRLTATDSWGRVHDGDGLRIADASLMCGPTIANPQGSVMAIAHRNALRAIERGFV